MATRGLYVFQHAFELGNAPTHELFKRIRDARNVDVPRDFDDYSVTVEDADLPAGVTLLRIVCTESRP